MVTTFSQPAAGRLGDADRSLMSDPRADPRMVAALEEFYLATNTPPPPVTHSSPRSAQLEFCRAAEENLSAMLEILAARTPEIDGVEREIVAIAARGGHELTLHIHRPRRLDVNTPCVVHLHGGGMVILEAAYPCYAAWRDRLASEGLTVVGVEFRNGAGRLGDHPFPAGLEDCVDAVRWAESEVSNLGGAGVVVNGESGGGNLALATAIATAREDRIAGVYAQCPYISGAWSDPPPDLPSLRENDGYFVSCSLFEVFSAVYDPSGAHQEDPRCWPLRATVDELRELPPHALSLNELDPLRDEGLAYYRRLLRAGVSAVGRVLPGTCHSADVLLQASLADISAATVRDIAGFALRSTAAVR